VAVEGAPSEAKVADGEIQFDAPVSQRDGYRTYEIIFE